MKFLTKCLPWFAAFTAVLHTVFGTVEIHVPLLQSALAPEIRLLLYACWHLVTVFLIGSAIVLFVAIFSRTQPPWIVAARAVGVLWIAAGAVFIGVSLVFSNAAMLFVLGQWILLIPIGLLAWFARYSAPVENQGPRKT